MGNDTANEPREHPEFNRFDAEDCDWCAEMDGPCPYHEGVGDGWEHAARAVTVALELVRPDDLIDARKERL